MRQKNGVIKEHDLI